MFSCLPPFLVPPRPPPGQEGRQQCEGGEKDGTLRRTSHSLIHSAHRLHTSPSPLLSHVLPPSLYLVSVASSLWWSGPSQRPLLTSVRPPSYHQHICMRLQTCTVYSVCACVCVHWGGQSKEHKILSPISNPNWFGTCTVPPYPSTYTHAPLVQGDRLYRWWWEELGQSATNCRVLPSELTYNEMYISSNFQK